MKTRYAAGSTSQRATAGPKSTSREPHIVRMTNSPCPMCTPGIGPIEKVR